MKLFWLWFWLLAFLLSLGFFLFALSFSEDIQRATMYLVLALLSRFELYLAEKTLHEGDN